MRVKLIEWRTALAVATTVIAGLTDSALAALPAPTAAQEQAQAAKKAATDAQAEQDKQKLAASMDALTARWRARAAASAWPTHPPVPVAPIAGFNASANQSSPSGQPGGRQGTAAVQAPVRSEKAGTAPASSDVKQPRPPQ